MQYPLGLLDVLIIAAISVLVLAALVFMTRSTQWTGAGRAVIVLATAACTIASALIVIRLTRAGRMPPEARYVSAGIMITFGGLLIAKAWTGRTELDEELASIGMTSLDRRLSQWLGKRYYNLRSFIVGATFVALGIRVVLP